MIVGMGIDVAEVKRIQAVIAAQAERFLRRVYTLDEVAYCEQFKNKFERYAGRFAVKEAAMKALGVGLGAFGWKDVEVVTSLAGRPSLSVRGAAAVLADDQGVENWQVSLTHTESLAQAVVAALR